MSDKSAELTLLVWKVINEIADQADKSGKFKVAITESVKGGIKVFIPTVIGGILFGPPGLVIGASVGAGLVVSTTRSYDGVVPLIAAMNESERDALLENFMRYVSDERGLSEAVLKGLLTEESRQFAEFALQKALEAMGIKRASQQ